MKATEACQPLATAENVIPLPIQPKPAKSSALPERFKIVPFKNRSGSQSWRVSGIKRDGTRIRDNFADQKAAECRQLELKTEYLTGHRETEVRSTRLTDEQIRLAELAFLRLGDDADLMLAVDDWLKHGKARNVTNSPRLDEAAIAYFDWLKESTLRSESKRTRKIHVNLFVGLTPNIRVCDITPETIDDFLSKRKGVSARTKENNRAGVSAFLSWCMDRKRKWIAVNPCAAVEVDTGEKPPPVVLTVEQCKALLRASEEFKKGKFAAYIAVCLFGGLRPSEAQRLTWENINLTDREIVLGAHQVKTGRKSGRGRTVAICDTLHAWLTAHKDKGFKIKEFAQNFIRVKAAAGFGNPTEKNPHLKPWVKDVMRHTAISNYFRKTGSYGQTAEQFGNSEAIIKAHYQGRVSTDDMKKFYEIKPRGKK